MAKRGLVLKKGQSSFEYIVLVAIVMLLVVSGIGIIYNYSQRSGDEVKMSTIGKIGVDLIDSIEKVYYLGGDSWQTINVNIPTGVRGVYVFKGNELVIEYESYGGRSEAIFFSDINMTTPYVDGDRANISDAFHPGLNIIRITNTGANVTIQETK